MRSGVRTEVLRDGDLPLWRCSRLLETILRSPTSADARDAHCPILGNGRMPEIGASVEGVFAKCVADLHK